MLILNYSVSDVFFVTILGVLCVVILLLGIAAIWLMLAADGGTETTCPTCGQSVPYATESSTPTGHQE